MATTHTTITDKETGATADIYAEAKLPTSLSDKQIDSTLAEASKALEAEKRKLSSQGKAIVSDAQALIDTTRKNELFQKLFAFARKAEEGVKEAGVPSSDLMAAGKTLVDRVTGMASSLQTDAEDVSAYIRNNAYNFLTNADYRNLASDFYSIIKSLAAEVEEEMDELTEEIKEEKGQPKKSRSSRPWNRPLNLQSTTEAGVETDASRLAKGVQREGFQEQKKGVQRRQRMKRTEAQMKELEDQAIEEIQENLNDFLSRIAEKKEYQSLVQNFFKYSDEVYELMCDVSEKAKQSPEAQKVRELLDQSYEILSDFAGKNTVEKYRKDLTSLWNKIRQDKDLKKWRETSRDYILDSLKNPQVDDATAQKAVETFKELIRDGRKVLRKYRKDIDAIYDDQVKIAQKIKDDPSLQEFERNLTNLGSHLALNTRGEVDPAVMQESMLQITNLMAGMFHKYLATLPISKVEIHSNDYDVCLSDIKVRGKGFAPDRMEISTKSYSILSFLEGETNKSALQITFSVENISPCFENFEYYFNKKSFPTYEDRGRATLECDEDGLSIRASLLIRTEGSEPPKCSLQGLVVRLGFISIITGAQTQHTILTPLLAPLFAETVRARIESLIYQSVRSRFDDIVLQVNQFFESNPIQRVTEKVASGIQANLPSMTTETKPKQQTKA